MGGGGGEGDCGREEGRGGCEREEDRGLCERRGRESVTRGLCYGDWQENGKRITGGRLAR